jgi:hypothetical protein
MMFDKFEVLGPDGTPITRLNSRLAEQQLVNDEELAALVYSHQLRHILFESAKMLKNDPLKLKIVARVFEALEFEQQKLWHFKENADYHRWFDLPGCLCPKMDNMDSLGTPYRVHAQNCPVHGFEIG